MKELFEFIKKSPTSAHTVNTVKEILIENGYTELSEKNPEAYSDGGRHFVIKGGSSLIVRPSGTEPLIRVMTEGDEPEIAESICRSLAEKIGKRIKELN